MENEGIGGPGRERDVAKGKASVPRNADMKAIAENRRHNK